MTKLASQAAYGRHRGVSRNRISVWKARGLIVFDPDGGVDFAKSDEMIAGHGGRLTPLPVAREAMAENVTGDADRSPSGFDKGLPSKTESERIRLNYEAMLLRLRFERESGKVAEIDDVAATVTAELACVRERLVQIGTRVGPQLAAMTNVEAVKAAIDDEVVAALTDLATDGPVEPAGVA